MSNESAQKKNGVNESYQNLARPSSPPPMRPPIPQGLSSAVKSPVSTKLSDDLRDIRHLVINDASKDTILMMLNAAIAYANARNGK